MGLIAWKWFWYLESGDSIQTPLNWRKGLEVEFDDKRSAMKGTNHSLHYKEGPQTDSGWVNKGTLEREILLDTVCEPHVFPS